jgi:hypothetical protein
MGPGLVYREICLKCGGNYRTDAEQLKERSRMTFESSMLGKFLLMAMNVLKTGP